MPTVLDYMDALNGSVNWVPSLTLAAHDWESPSKNQPFKSNSNYQVQRKGSDKFFPWKSIWCVKCPPHMAFFIWTAVKGKILTINKLGKRGIIITDRCCMCKSNGVLMDLSSFIVRLQTWDH